MSPNKGVINKISEELMKIEVVLYLLSDHRNSFTIPTFSCLLALDDEFLLI